MIESNMILFYILLDFKIYDFHLHYLYCTFCVVYSNLNMHTTGMYNTVMCKVHVYVGI